MATAELQGRTSEFGMGSNSAPTTVTDVTDYILDFSWNIEADEVEVNAWGTGAFVPTLQGKRSGTVDITFMNDAAHVMEDRLYDLQDSGVAIDYEYFPKGDATGKPSRTGSMRLLSISEDNSGEASDILSYQTSWKLQEQPTRAIIA